MTALQEGRMRAVLKNATSNEQHDHYSVRLFFGTTKEIGRMMNEIIQTVVLNSISKKGVGFYLYNNNIN